MDAIGCQTFFWRADQHVCLWYFLKFLVGASRFVVDTLHPLAPPCLWDWLLSEPPEAIYFRTKL